MPKTISSWFKKFLIWRIRHINSRNFVSILSVLVGFCAGIAAVIIKNAVHFTREFLQNFTTEEYKIYLYLILPISGIFLAVLFIKYILKQPVRHGIPNVLYSISKNSSHIKTHNMFSSIIASTLTVGFGGSVGLEGPTVATGAAIGSNLGRLFHLNYKQITLLLGCACAGAMAAIFKSPIAAIVFALEVIMLDLTMASLIPLLLASSTAVLTSMFFLGKDVLYPVEVSTAFELSKLYLYIILGIIAGLTSSYFTKMYMFIGSIFDKFKNNYSKLLLGALSLGVLIFFFPSLYGEGYEEINMTLSGDFSYLFENTIFEKYSENIVAGLILLLGVILMKVIAASATFGSGGVGGIFAPTLFTGSTLGLLFALTAQQLGADSISVSSFALVGMAGMLAGNLHAPLTGIFLIAEITGGYGLFIPLMLTSTFSYATVRYLEPNSVYTIQLARRKELITHDKDKAVLSLMRIEKLIEKNFSIIRPDMSLGEFVEVVSKSERNVFPVVDDDDLFLGVVFINDVREVIFKHDLYDKLYVHEMMFMPNGIVDPDDSMEDIAQKFQNTGNFNLPVIKDGKYLGFVSRANVFSTYRRMLKHFSED
jgi:chloride channel protein, CIC family